jgi:hypothetical protein
MSVTDSTTQDSDREMVAKALRRLFELWNLDAHQSASILGLTEEDSRWIQIARGDPLPPEPAVIARARTLLRIHRNLQLLLPTSPQVASKWMHAPNPALNGETPLATICNEGDAGVEKISSLLQRQFAR